MRHPVEEVGDKRLCPETGRPFRECWTNNRKEPWTAFNECQECSPGHETIADMLHRLNRERANQ